MACPSQPPCRFDTKVESQIQPGEKPGDSVNLENALAGITQATRHLIVIVLARRGLAPSLAALPHYLVQFVEYVRGNRLLLPDLFALLPHCMRPSTYLRLWAI